MPERDASAKLRIYFTIYRLNLSFANIVANCRALGESGNFEPEVHPALPVVCTGTAGRNQRGSDGHHGRGRIARHAPVRQGEDCEGKGTPRPNDVFIHTEERRRELARQGKKPPPLKRSKTLRSQPGTARKSKRSSSHSTARRLRR